MVLHTREFGVNGATVIVGHDRETGKRYYVDVQGDNIVCLEAKSIEIHLFTSEENYIFLVDCFGMEHTIFYDTEDPEKVVTELKSIFWIE